MMLLATKEKEFSSIRIYGIGDSDNETKKYIKEKLNEESSFRIIEFSGHLNLTELPDLSSSKNTLKSLDLGNNSINDISQLRDFSNLEDLNLNKNSFSDEELDMFEKMPSLKNISTSSGSFSKSDLFSWKDILKKDETKRKRIEIKKKLKK